MTEKKRKYVQSSCNVTQNKMCKCCGEKAVDSPKAIYCPECRTNVNVRNFKKHQDKKLPVDHGSWMDVNVLL
jgi:hypothetical protein